MCGLPALGLQAAMLCLPVPCNAAQGIVLLLLSCGFLQASGCSPKSVVPIPRERVRSG
ncbi:unnamed protein product, partial [Bubo scandiacus]